MKKLSKIILLIIAGGFISSCDDKLTSLEELNQAPEFQFFRKSSINWETPNGTTIVDSAKIFNNSNNASYPAILRIVDPNYNTSLIRIQSSEPDTSFFVDGNTYYSNYQVNNNEEFNIAFRSSTPATLPYTVYAVDDFGKRNEMHFNIEYRPNKLPIPRLEVVLVNGNTKNYQLKGQNSFDRDKLIGGAVVEYEFVIDNVVIHTSEPNINHIFTLGQHTVKLRVMDNDDQWSEYVSISVNVT